MAVCSETYMQTQMRYQDEKARRLRIQEAAEEVVQFLTGDDEICAAFSGLAGGASEQFKSAVEKLDNALL